MEHADDERPSSFVAFSTVAMMIMVPALTSAEMKAVIARRQDDDAPIIFHKTAQDMVYMLDHGQLRFSMDDNKGKYLMKSSKQRGSMLKSILGSHRALIFVVGNLKFMVSCTLSNLSRYSIIDEVQKKHNIKSIKKIYD